MSRTPPKTMLLAHTHVRHLRPSPRPPQAVGRLCRAGSRGPTPGRRTAAGPCSWGTPGDHRAGTEPRTEPRAESRPCPNRCLAAHRRPCPGPARGHRRRLLAARRGQRGFQLLELVVVLVVFALLASMVTPSLMRASARLRLHLAATELAGVLRHTRALAITRSANVAVKFRTSPGGRVTYTLYRDGDGDGVRSRDIERGTDPPLGPPRRLSHFGPSLRFGFPPEKRPRKVGGRGRIGRLQDPIRFNRSDLASFGPLGTATPGSLYFTDGRDRLAVVRVFHRTGKVRILHYDARSETWK